MNPLTCGYYGDSLRACTCSGTTVTRCQMRLSAPLLDRIDIHVEVPRVEYGKLASDRLVELSSSTLSETDLACGRPDESPRVPASDAPQGEQAARGLRAGTEMAPKPRGKVGSDGYDAL